MNLLVKTIKNHLSQKRLVLICFLFVVTACAISMAASYYRVSQEKTAISKLSRLYPYSQQFYGVSLVWSGQKNPDVWCEPIQNFISYKFGFLHAHSTDGYYLAGDHEITDETIDLLLKLKRMKALNFSSTKISDEVLLRLREFPMLMELQLIGVEVSEETLELLKQSNPDLVILQ